MKHSSLVQFVGCAVALAAVATVEPAVAQTICPEGRTLSGACINPGLAASSRARAILATQEKFSYSARLVPPTLYSLYPTTFDYREYYYYQQFQPFNGLNGFYLSCHPHC